MKQHIFQRSYLIGQLEANSSWDLIVIGGGASGLGVALDALSRGFKTLLLAQNAPYLVSNLSFVIPNYSWRSGPFYTIGMKLYDLLAGRLSLGKSIHLGRRKTLKRISTVKPRNLRDGVVYHDAQFDDARLAVNLAQTCLEMGGIAINYFPVTGLIKDESGKG